MQRSRPSTEQCRGAAHRRVPALGFPPETLSANVDGGDGRRVIGSCPGLPKLRAGREALIERRRGVFWLYLHWTIAPDRVPFRALFVGVTTLVSESPYLERDSLLCLVTRARSGSRPVTIRQHQQPASIPPSMHRALGDWIPASQPFAKVVVTTSPSFRSPLFVLRAALFSARLSSIAPLPTYNTKS